MALNNEHTMTKADSWLEKALIKEQEGNISMADRLLNQACKVENEAYATGDRRNK